MVLNSRVVVGVANLSANACQYIACNPERLPSDQVLYLLFCFPFQQIRRLSLCFCTFFCFPLLPPPPSPHHHHDGVPSLHNNSFYLSSSSSSSSSSDSDDYQDAHPHLH